MSAAFVIEVQGLQAGLVVREAGGFRFFAAVAEAFSLDGRVFQTVAQATRAVAKALARKRPR